MTCARHLMLRRASLALAIVVAAVAFPQVSWAQLTPQQSPRVIITATTIDEAPSCQVRVEIAGEWVPMCTTEGASAVAPKPVHGPSDARIEALERDRSFELADQLTRPGDDAPQKSPSSFTHASLCGPPQLEVPQARLVLLGRATGSDGDTTLVRGVYRPPRN